MQNPVTLVGEQLETKTPIFYNRSRNIFDIYFFAKIPDWKYLLFQTNQAKASPTHGAQYKPLL